jgi:hypothetical protein
MKKSSWIRGAGVALGLAVGGLLYAQTSSIPPAPTPLYQIADTEKYSFLNVTEGDFMNVTSYANKPINENETTDMNARVSGGDSRKGVKPRFYVMDPSKAFQMDIDYLNSKEGRNFYASKGKEDERSKLIGRFQGFIDKLKKAKIAPDKESLEQLCYDLAINNGILTPDGFKGVKDNLYAFIKEGYDSEKGNYRVIYIAPVVSETTSTKYQEIIKADEDLIQSQRGYIKKIETPIQAQIPTVPPAAPLEQAITQTPISKKPNLELYFDILSAPGILGITTDENGNPDLLNSKGGPGFVSAKVGLIGRINDWFEFGGNLNGAIGFPEEVASVQTQPGPTGRYFTGSKTNENFFRVGADVDFYFGDNFFFGLGPNVWIYGQKTLENVLDSKNNVVASSSNEVMKSAFSGDFYLGIRKNEAGVIIGWDSRKGIYAGARIMIPLDKK